MRTFYRFEETTNMEHLQEKVSSYGAVLKYGEQVLVTDLGWKGFVAAVYEFIETPEECGFSDIECRLNLVEAAEELFEDGGHAMAWCLGKVK